MLLFTISECFGLVANKKGPEREAAETMDREALLLSLCTRTFKKSVLFISLRLLNDILDVIFLFFLC